MRITEKILIAFCFIGMLMNIFDIAGGSPLIFFGFTALGIFYLFLGWLLIRDREAKKYYLGISIPLGIVLSATCIAILFKFLFWIGRDEMLAAALILMVPVLIIVLILYNKQKGMNGNAAGAYRKALQRLIPFFVIAATLFLIPEEPMIRFKYRKDPEYARLYIRALKHPDNEQYWREFEDYQVNKYFMMDTITDKP